MGGSHREGPQKSSKKAGFLPLRELPFIGLFPIMRAPHGMRDIAFYAAFDLAILEAGEARREEENPGVGTKTLCDRR